MRHQVMSGYSNFLASLTRWFRLRSCLASASDYGIAALDAIIGNSACHHHSSHAADTNARTSVAGHYAIIFHQFACIALQQAVSSTVAVRQSWPRGLVITQLEAAAHAQNSF